MKGRTVPLLIVGLVWIPLLCLCLKEYGDETFSDPRSCMKQRFETWTKRPTRRETFYRVTSARVLVADYDTLRKDYPPLRSLSREKIDAWLIENFAFMGQQQFEVPAEYKFSGKRVSTPIPTDKSIRKWAAIRPLGYHRAAIFSVSDPLNKEEPSEDPAEQWRTATWFDVKGIGMTPGRIPKLESHMTGLHGLYKGLLDFVTEKAFRFIFELENAKPRPSPDSPRYGTVPTYALIDLGFDLLGDGNPALFKPLTGNIPAGLVIRKVTCRRPVTHDLPKYLDVELALRKYGFTSCRYTTEQQTDWCFMNIQMTDNNDLIDFESYNLPYKEMLLSPVNANWLKNNTESVFNTSAHLPDPNEATSSDDEVWGCPPKSACLGSGKLIQTAVHELVMASRNGLSKDAFEKKVNEILYRLTFVRRRGITRLLNPSGMDDDDLAPPPNPPPVLLEKNNDDNKDNNDNNKDNNKDNNDNNNKDNNKDNNNKDNNKDNNNVYTPLPTEPPTTQTPWRTFIIFAVLTVLVAVYVAYRRIQHKKKHF